MNVVRAILTALIVSLQIQAQCQQTLEIRIVQTDSIYISSDDYGVSIILHCLAGNSLGPVMADKLRC